MVDSSSPWFPVKESDLQLDESDRVEMIGIDHAIIKLFNPASGKALLDL